MKKDRNNFLPGLLFLVMSTVFFAMQISFGLRFLNRLWPDDLITRVLTLTVFDVGALGWFLVWLKLAHGDRQRGIATVLFILDLLGASAVALSEVFSAASGWMNADLIINLRVVSTWVLGIWVVVNLAAAYAFKYFSPATQLEIQIANEKDEVVRTAVEMAVNHLQSRTPALAKELSDEIYADAEHDLRVTAKKALAKDEQGRASEPTQLPGIRTAPGIPGSRVSSLPTQQFTVPLNLEVPSNGSTPEPNPTVR